MNARLSPIPLGPAKGAEVPRLSDAFVESARIALGSVAPARRIRQATRLPLQPVDLSRSAGPTALTPAHCLRSAARATRLLQQVAEIARALPNHRTSFAERAYALHHAARAACRSQGLTVRISGAQLPERCVLVANHLSYLDPLVIAALGPTLAVAKAELSAWPLVGSVLGRLGVLFVNRTDPHSGARVLRTALRALKSGTRVLTFPEGTTTDGQRVLAFKLGAFGLARLAGVPVIPIAVRMHQELCWTGDAAFLPHYLKSVRLPELQVELSLGSPIWPEASDARMASAARAQITRMLGNQASARRAAHEPTIRA